jgi:membrane protease subunit HflC
VKKLITTLVVVFIVLVVFILLGPFYIVNEGEQAVVTRFGAIVDTSRATGLKFKMPLVDTVVKYPTRILSWDGEAQRIPTRENQFIWVDSTARWLIVNPELYYESVITIEGGYARLDDLIDSSVRTIISQNNLREAVRNSNVINRIERQDPIAQGESSISQEEVDLEELRKLTFTETSFEEIKIGREQLSRQIQEEAAKLMPQFGIELIDVIIRQIRYSDELTESVYSRMIKERNQIASAYRSYGEGQKAEWLGRLENERRSVLSGAYKEAETLKGTADATATQVYADAYETDPGFFSFWRSIESYRRTLPRFRKVLTTDMEYFDYLYDQDGR